MNYLLCKVKDRKKKNIMRKMMATEDEIFRIPNLGQGIPFQVKYTLEEDEWFVIDNFTDTEYCIDLLKEDFDSTKYSLEYRAKSGNINYLCAYQGNNNFCFQRVMPSSLVKKKRFIGIGDAICIRDIDYGIALREVPDAIFMKDCNRLFFKRLEAITTIFKGIQTIYREATDEEVTEFMKQDFIEACDGYGTEKIGKANRKRLAWATDKLKDLNSEQKLEIFNYIHEYKPQLSYHDKKFTIGSEEDLKNLCYGIDQRFYTTEVTKEARLANSVLNI